MSQATVRESGPSLRRLVPPALVLIALGTATALIAQPRLSAVWDVQLYRAYAEWTLGGFVPYHDFPAEYPPLALVPMLIATLPGGGLDGFELSFALLMLAAGVLVLWLTAQLAGSDRGVRAAWFVALGLPLLATVARARFDLFPIALTLGALLAIARARPRLGFALLGAGAMVKLFPLALAPVAAVWLVRRGERRAAIQGLAICAAVVVVCSVPFMSEGYIDAYTFHLERPVQIESAAATAIFALGDYTVTGTPGNPDRFKSNGLEAPSASIAAALSTALQLLALLGALLVAARGPRTRDLVLGSAVAVLAVIALGKVLSPQFLLWVVPFSGLAWAYRERAVAILTALAVALTSWEYPGEYGGLVAGDPLGIWLVGVRNALLLLALTLLLARAAAGARWRRPAAAHAR